MVDSLLRAAQDSFDALRSEGKTPYKIIIFDEIEDGDFERLNDKYRLDSTDFVLNESQLDAKDVLLYEVCPDRDSFIEKWEELLDTHEGAWYCCMDVNNTTITAGAFDPDDRINSDFDHYIPEGYEYKYNEPEI